MKQRVRRVRILALSWRGRHLRMNLHYQRLIEPYVAKAAAVLAQQIDDEIMAGLW